MVGTRLTGSEFRGLRRRRRQLAFAFFLISKASNLFEASSRPA